MTDTALRRTRPLTIIAQDPTIRVGGRILTQAIEVPAEALAAGPWGYRVHVIDSDASSGELFRAHIGEEDGFVGVKNDGALLDDPHFHAQNVYAIVMATLARFEHALGRRVSWSFDSHQIKVAPHAFADANAFYSRRDEALLFGYFPGRRGTVFSCLSHDVVAHETTHALLDGLRERYTDPSSPDQAAFHEGFADVVALLSIFSLRNVVDATLAAGGPGGGRTISRDAVAPEKLRRTTLLGLAEQLGDELQALPGRALRQSAELEPSPRWYHQSTEFEEPHRRGEILVAAMMNSFLAVWAERLKPLIDARKGPLDLGRVVEEGALAADRLLTMAIRALDYAQPVDLQFGDYLSALLTGDHELRPDDSHFNYRRILREVFASYGIRPSSHEPAAEPGLWAPPPGEPVYNRIHFESLQRDKDEVFRFLWENKDLLKLNPNAYTRVLSVRPCVRVDTDGFTLRETVAEFMQILEVRGDELKGLGLRAPTGMRPGMSFPLYGGGVLIFDEYGRLKLCVGSSVSGSRQQARLDYLWERGAFRAGAADARRFSSMHRRRAMGQVRNPVEGW